MRRKAICLLFMIMVFCFVSSASSQDSRVLKRPPATAAAMSVDEILRRVEARYNVAGFTADFLQTSTLKAMEITENASGRAFFKRPGKMRWEYLEPNYEKKTIISDGIRVWIHRPDDNQVLIGEAPSIFGDGQGASFLSDIRMLRRKFYIKDQAPLNNDNYRLTLLPIEKNLDISVVYLSIAAQTFEVVEIVTHNSDGDTTKIGLSNIDLKEDLDDNLFVLQIPKDADIQYFDR